MSDVMPNKVDISIGKIFKTATNSLMFTGFLILVACVGTLTKNSTIGILTGYSFIIVGTIMFISIIVQKVSGTTTSTEAKSVLSSITTIGPMLMFTMILSFVTYLIGKHFEPITEGHVSTSFSGMLNLLNIIIMVILYLFYKMTTTDKYKETGEIDKVMGMGTYFLNLIGVVILKTIYIILTFYTTDG